MAAAGGVLAGGAAEEKGDNARLVRSGRVEEGKKQK